MSKYDKVMEILYAHWDELPAGVKGDLEVLEESEVDDDEM
jgi:hypothetical protein